MIDACSPQTLSKALVPTVPIDARRGRGSFVCPRVSPSVQERDGESSCGDARQQCTPPPQPKLSGSVPDARWFRIGPSRWRPHRDVSAFIGQPNTNLAHLDDQARACFLCWLAPSQRGFHSNFRRCETLRFNSVLSLGRGCDCRADTHKRAIRVG